MNKKEFEKLCKGLMAFWFPLILAKISLGINITEPPFIYFIYVLLFASLYVAWEQIDDIIIKRVKRWL